MNAAPAELLELVDGAFRQERPGHIGVAVSGGSDSLALLMLARTWARQNGITVSAVTVDHGLRREAGDEAQMVAGICSDRKIPHDIVKWHGWDGAGNLQAEARQARYRLIADWATRTGVSHVLLGHTADDQAETFLIRLAREAGVDGLSAMQAKRVIEGVVFLRPLLAARRGALQSYLRGLGVDWVSDPSNEDRRFQRVRVRDQLAALAPLGIDADVLCAVVRHQQSAREALQLQTLAAARKIARTDHGDVLFDADAMRELPAEIRRRLLVQALKWVATAFYGPRHQALEKLEAALQSGKKSTLHGCVIGSEGQAFRVTREYRAVQDKFADVDAVWDGRWSLKGPEKRNLEVRALGPAGILHCPDWRETGRPRHSVLASPSLWRGSEFIAAPLAGAPRGWQAQLAAGEDHFFTSVLSH